MQPSDSQDPTKKRKPRLPRGSGKRKGLTAPAPFVNDPNMRAPIQQQQQQQQQYLSKPPLSQQQQQQPQYGTPQNRLSQQSSSGSLTAPAPSSSSPTFPLLWYFWIQRRQQQQRSAPDPNLIDTYLLDKLYDTSKNGLTIYLHNTEYALPCPLRVNILPDRFFVLGGRDIQSMRHSMNSTLGRKLLQAIDWAILTQDIAEVYVELCGYNPLPQGCAVLEVRDYCFNPVKRSRILLKPYPPHLNDLFKEGEAPMGKIPRLDVSRELDVKPPLGSKQQNPQQPAEQSTVVLWLDPSPAAGRMLIDSMNESRKHSFVYHPRPRFMDTESPLFLETTPSLFAPKMDREEDVLGKDNKLMRFIMNHQRQMNISVNQIPSDEESGLKAKPLELIPMNSPVQMPTQVIAKCCSDSKTRVQRLSEAFQAMTMESPQCDPQWKMLTLHEEGENNIVARGQKYPLNLGTYDETLLFLHHVTHSFIHPEGSPIVQVARLGMDAQSRAYSAAQQMQQRRVVAQQPGAQQIQVQAQQRQMMQQQQPSPQPQQPPHPSQPMAPGNMNMSMNMGMMQQQPNQQPQVTQTQVPMGMQRNMMPYQQQVVGQQSMAQQQQQQRQVMTNRMQPGVSGAMPQQPNQVAYRPNVYGQNQPVQQQYQQPVRPGMYPSGTTQQNVPSGAMHSTQVAIPVQGVGGRSGVPPNAMNVQMLAHYGQSPQPVQPMGANGPSTGTMYMRQTGAGGPGPVRQTMPSGVVSNSGNLFQCNEPLSFAQHNPGPMQQPQPSQIAPPPTQPAPPPSRYPGYGVQVPVRVPVPVQVPVPLPPHPQQQPPHMLDP